MGFYNCCHCKCCFSCFYRRCFCFGDSCCCRRNKTSPDYDKSPPPSIALTIATASRSQADDQSIQDQLSLFHFGQKSASSGRRYSHPNQAKWVEEYERRKSQPGSPSPSGHFNNDSDNDNLSPDVIPPRPPESPIMQYPVIPPGRLL